MLGEICNLVSGPYFPGEETRFKADVIAAQRRKNAAVQYFRIETEETEPGFPDVLAVDGKRYLLIEFKVSGKSGILTFRQAQPLFYKKHAQLNIKILAWDVPGNRLLCIGPGDVVDAKTLRFPCPKGGVPALAGYLNMGGTSPLSILT